MRKQKRIEALTEAQRAKMAGWADKWIKIGLSTEPVNWPRVEAAIRECLTIAGQRADVPVVRVPSPLVGALAFPLAAGILAGLGKEGLTKDDIVHSAVDSAVHSAVDSAVDSAVGSAVHSAVHSAVDSAVDSDAKLEVIDRDVDRHGQPRTLYRDPDGRLIAHYFNSTLDGDGTRREYTCTCHPELRPWGKTGEWDGPAQKLTVLNAIASTYGKTGEQYARVVEET